MPPVPTSATSSTTHQLWTHWRGAPGVIRPGASAANRYAARAPMDRKPKMDIIIASTRPGRVGLPIARWFRTRAEIHGGFEVEWVDLAEWNLPFMDEPHHPRLGKYEHAHTL